MNDKSKKIELDEWDKSGARVGLSGTRVGLSDFIENF
jgi:hypothetical protein